MRITTSRRSVKRDKRGLSNIIVVVLSLVILVVIVANVILWSYQMNQMDWERTQENFIISGVSQLTGSPWCATSSEYQIREGNLVSGSYLNTQTIDGNLERFRESPPPRGLDINGTFSINISGYMPATIRSVEIQLRYAVDDVGERWFLRAYNWTSRSYSDNGFNSTTGHLPGSGWNSYAVNLTDKWHSYVWNDGTIIIQLRDQMPDATRTNIDIDYLAVRVGLKGTVFTFKNEGSRTTHIVSIWVNSAEAHLRYETDLFVNSAETYSYTRADISLPTGQFTVRVITERGNIAVYANS